MSQFTTEQILNQCFSDSANTLSIACADTLSVAQATGTPQYGTDATGADAYATIVTASAAKTHLYVVNAGTHPAILSLDGGTTDHLYIPGSSAAAFDNITIAASAAIQAKNGTAGSNYTSLYITIW